MIQKKDLSAAQVTQYNKLNSPSKSELKSFFNHFLKNPEKYDIEVVVAFFTKNRDGILFKGYTSSYHHKRIVVPTNFFSFFKPKGVPLEK